MATIKAADDDVATTEKQGQFAFLPERTCAICYQDQNPTSTSEADILGSTSAGGIIGSVQTDITNPYETIPCGCIYCFVCITEKLEAEEGEGWSCLRCGDIVKQCKPWNGDVLEEAPRSTTTGKVVGFTFTEENQERSSPEEKEEEGAVTAGNEVNQLTDIVANDTLHISKTWSMIETEILERDGPESIGA